MAAINNDILRDIRLIAIDSHYSNSIESFIEKACRYYSKTYHTPLASVYSLNPLEVLKVYMEDELDDMTPEDIKSILDKINPPHKPMLNAEELMENNDIEELDDDAWVAQQIAEAEKKEKAAEKKQPKDQDSSMASAAMQAQKAIQGLYQQINKPNPEELDGDIKFDIKE